MTPNDRTFSRREIRLLPHFKLLLADASTCRISDGRTKPISFTMSYLSSRYLAMRVRAAYAARMSKPTRTGSPVPLVLPDKFTVRLDTPIS